MATLIFYFSYAQSKVGIKLLNIARNYPEGHLLSVTAGAISGIFPEKASGAIRS